MPKGKVTKRGSRSKSNAQNLSREKKVSGVNATAGGHANPIKAGPGAASVSPGRTGWQQSAFNRDQNPTK